VVEESTGLDRVTRKSIPMNRKEKEMSGTSTTADTATLNVIPAQDMAGAF
jgi:hypothetical protein